MVQQWHVQKDRLGQEGSRLTRKRRIAEQASQHLRNHDPREATSRGRRSSTDRRVLGSTIDRPRTHPSKLHGNLKVFGAVDKLVTIVAGEVSVNAVASGADLERALQYGNQSSVTEHLPAI